jgi:two-component system, LytTR family, sensor histidine kinase AlgZ
MLLGAVVALVFSDLTIRTPWRVLANGFLTSLLFTLCIGPVTAYAMPRLAPWIACRLRSPFNWLAIAATMTLFALGGSAVAIGILVLIGYIPAYSFWHWYANSIRVSIAVTLTVGLFITAFEMNRARLAQANAQARLSSLESRVQPHFLFNTLNSIAALTHEDPVGAERMTTQLAALLRSSLESSDAALVPLGDELALVRHYLDIERVRFGDRLRFTIVVDGAPITARVPRMAIQTLVENSVKYAVSPRRDGATIGIYAGAANGRLRIEVRDDGPGFDAAEVPPGHGLALLRDRLQLLFENRASLEIAADAGARVAIDVPLQPSAPSDQPTRVS